MARPISDDIYRLAKTLSHSEYLTLADDAAKSSHSTVQKGEKPQYLLLVEYLRQQEKYDDAEARQELGFDVASSRWRSLKRDTIKMMEQAIDRARENQVPEFVLSRIPARVENLLRKHLWARAEQVVDKYLEIASKTERFESELKLIKQKAIIVQAIYKKNEAIDLLANLQKRRLEVRRRLMNIEEFQDLWNLISLEAKTVAGIDSTVVSEALEKPIVANRATGSLDAELLYWKILRRCNFLLRRTNGFISALNGGIEFILSTSLNAERSIALLQFLSDRTMFAIRSHVVSDYEEGIRELQKMTTQIPEFKIEIEGRIHLLTLTFSRTKMERETILKNCKQFTAWFKVNRDHVPPHLLIRCIRRCAELQFYVNNLSEAAKWTHRLRTFPPKNEAINHLCFGWVFYLIVRLEMNDTDILTREIEPTVRFLQKNCVAPGFYIAIISYIKDQIEKGEKNTANLGEIYTFYQQAILPKSAHFFPFDLWIEARTKGLDLLSLIGEGELPREEL